MSTARPEDVDPKTREDWKGLSTTRNSRKCTIDDHRMWTGRVQHEEWSLFFVVWWMDTKIKVHGTFWQECILQRIEMLLAQWRTLRVYVECWQFPRFLREDHWSGKDATLSYANRGSSLLHSTKWPLNKGFTLFAQNVGHHEPTFSTGYQ